LKGNILNRGENTWLIRVDFPPGADGKYQHKEETVEGSREGAEKRLSEILRERETGMASEAGKITVAE
jgi:hypothetical protein